MSHTELSGDMMPLYDARSIRLEDALANRQWIRRSKPFPHIVASNVFRPHVYQELSSAFAQLLETSDDTLFNLGKLHKRSSYDVSSVGFTPATTGPLSLFLSQEWHDLLKKVMSVDATGDVNGGLHHHRVASQSGRIHNDLNPGWFIVPDVDRRVNVSDARCNYQSGATSEEPLAIRESVRAAAMLFYLNNGEWQPGDGGETGLYASASDTTAAAVVPPIDNSLLLFECTPYSYHRYLSNRKRVRNSVILWIHRTKEEATARWGADKIVYWPARPK